MNLVEDWKLLSLAEPIGPAMAWTRLTQYHNADFVCQILKRLHSPDPSQAANLKRHARDIRYCLVQAREYFDSASAVGYATRGVLQYYGVTSLALAQILLRGGGKFRLSELRKTEGHHGLTFPAPNVSVQGRDAGVGALRAVPASIGGRRWGTFDVWHRLSRHYPTVGKLVRRYAEFPNSWGPEILFVPDGDTPPPIPSAGLGLLSALQHLPGMVSHLALHEYQDSLARAKVQVEVELFGNNETHTEVLVHPDRKEKLDQLRERFHAPPGAFERLTVDEYASGFRVSAKSDKDVRHMIRWPIGVSHSIDLSHLYIDDFPLNEFGCFYVGLYCAGMYARYFPDMWMRDIELANERFGLLSSFLDLASHRLPIVALMDPSRTFYLAVK